jgi:adenylate kinase
MRLVFIGPPGAGKGTQAKMLRDHYKIAHISTGDMLRDRIATGTPTGLKARPFVESGGLVPDGIIVEMVVERLAEPDCSTGFLFDGFPRTLAQAAALDDTLRTTGQDLDAVVLLDVDDDELVRRLGSRWTCGNTDCRAVYNLVTQPPKLAGKCDRCGNSLIQREDDKPETIRTRLQKYHQQTAPVVEYYRQQGLLRTVPGTGTVDEIQRNIRASLGD